jgi:hypothetical protein
MTWLEDVMQSLKELGGTATLDQIGDLVAKKRAKTPNFASTVRATIYNHSSDARGYRFGSPDLFRQIGKATWAIRTQSDSPRHLPKPQKGPITMRKAVE